MTGASNNRHSSELSLSPAKRQAFETDLYFRECRADLVDVGGDDALGAVDSLALLTFKPDAVVGRRMAQTLEFLDKHDFDPVGLAPVRYTRHSMRALWRYNWDTYTTDRLALTTIMHSSAETLLLLLHSADGIPASVRLSDLKGNAAPELRRPGQLRDLLAPPNEVINFVHVADEPGDVVRELGIFLDRRERRRLLREALAAPPHADLRRRAREEVARLELTYPPHDFDFDRSIRRLGGSGAASRADVDRLVAARRSGPKLSWDDLCAIAAPEREDVDLWDLASIACGVLELVRPGSADLLPAAGVEAWAEHLGRGPAGTARR